MREQTDTDLGTVVPNVGSDYSSVAIRTASVYKTDVAGVAELADALDLGSCARKGVGVRLPPSANDVLKSSVVEAAGLLLFTGQAKSMAFASTRASPAFDEPAVAMGSAENTVF